MSRVSLDSISCAPGFQLVDYLNSPLRIAYRTELPTPAVWVKRLDGSDTRQIFEDFGISSVCPLSWSPDGKTLYHAYYGLVAIDVMACTSETIFSLPDRLGGYIHWHLKCSQNGDFLSFLCDNEMGFGQDLCCINCDGSDFQNILVSDAYKHIDNAASQIHGDQLLLHIINKWGKEELWMIDNQGRNARQIGVYVTKAMHSTLSSDGNLVAFCLQEERPEKKTLFARKRSASQPAPTQYQLYLHTIATKQTRKLPSLGEHPSFSPDGKQIAFVNGDAMLCLLDLAQNQVQKLVWFDDEPVNDWPFGSNYAQQPIWSDDGRFLWFGLTSWNPESRPLDYKPPLGSGLVFNPGTLEHRHRVGVIDFLDKRIWVMDGYWLNVAWEPTSEGVP